jgi:hypothetical protein
LSQIAETCFQRCSLQSICIPRSIEILGRSCFLGASGGVEKELGPESTGSLLGREKRIVPMSVTFESKSLLMRFEESCFRRCSLESICIPRSVEVLRKLCFSSSTFALITFENESALARIEDLCFKHC